MIFRGYFFLDFDEPITKVLVIKKNKDIPFQKLRNYVTTLHPCNDKQPSIKCFFYYFSRFQFWETQTMLENNASKIFVKI